MLLQFIPEEIHKCQQAYRASTDVPPSPASDGPGSRFSFLKILIFLRVENKSKGFFYCMRIICYCNSAAMVLAACRRRGLSISCILFVKTLHWLTKRFRYCKERLKERMIYLNIKREVKVLNISAVFSYSS
ncbi:hypothetical protein ACB092_02G253300 [Castanea dentata]